MASERVILHYDMDAFYASVEIRDNPKLKGKPIVVGENIVTTASYEARKYGVRSAMPVSEARKLCKNLIALPVSKGKYSEVSSRIKSLVLKLTHRVEFIALDEGYIDITEIIERYPSKKYFANRFKRGIFNNVSLTCSIGIGYNKLSAKIASDINKPGGIYIFNTREEFVDYIKDKNIKILPGVGKKLQFDLEKLGVEKVEDIYPFSHSELLSKLGRTRGELLYQYSRGYDYRRVDYKRKTHSIGNENTFRYYLETREEVLKEMEILFVKTYERLLLKKFLAKTIVVKVRYSNRKTITRSKTFEDFTRDRITLYEAMMDIIEDIDFEGSIRLLGVSFGNLSQNSSKQLTFDDRKSLKKRVDIELLKEKIKRIEKKIK